LLNQQTEISPAHESHQSAYAEDWISSETIAQLRKISTKNENSLNLNENIDICFAVTLSLEEWRAMTKNGNIIHLLERIIVIFF